MIRAYFDNKKILRAIIRQIRSSERVYGCVAWCTQEKILDEMERIPTELIMTKHKSNRWQRNIKVKFIGSGRGRKKVLMHHKFVIGFIGKKPAWVITGSFNFTKSAARHHENIVIIECPNIAQQYYDEFCKLKEL